MSLPSASYEKLFQSVAGVYDQALKEVNLAVDGILKKAYWEIGRLMVEVEQKGKARSDYGDRLLEKLSSDLTGSNRKGFSVSNLRNMRLVYLAFPIHQLTDELTWSHYVALSAVKDSKQRLAYQNLAVRKHLNVEDLKNLLIEDKIVTLPPQSAIPQSPSGKKDPPVIRFSVTRGLLYTHRVVEKEHIPVTPGQVLVDCGFFIYHQLAWKGKDIPAPGTIFSAWPAVNTSSPLIFKVWEKKEVTRRVLYTYRAVLDHAADGDTITVLAECGFGIFSKQKLRLRRINAPEVDTPEGQKARAFVSERLQGAKSFIVKTYSTDIYDRYLVDVFYLPGEADPQKIAAEGVYLNQELIDAGLAKVWQTVDPDDLAFMN